MTCRIFHVDDHALTRAGCRLMLSNNPELEIVAECDCGGQVLERVRADKPDLVLLDIRLPDVSGLTLIAEIISTHEIPVAILSGQEDPRDFIVAWQMGASAIVDKRDTAETIIHAIELARSGERYVSDTVANVMASIRKPTVSLSSRQAAILHFLSIGETNKEIAHRLGIAMPTVSFHLAELRRKLGVESNKRILPVASEINLI